jgi:putative inorganic carbon (HCO3(-)) transporter
MHFGLEGFIGLALYISFIAASLLSVFWRPITGIYYLAALIPLQTLRYHLNAYPLGGTMVGIIIIAVAAGILRKGGSILPKTPWTKLLLFYIFFTFLSLCLGSFYLDKPLPLPGDARFGVWQDYMTMPALLFVVAGLRPTQTEIRNLLIVMCLSTFVLDKGFWDTVSGRDFSTYNAELRDEGNMGYAGTNGLAAYEAQFATFLIALASYETKFWLRLGYYVLSGFSALCLMYSLSRGGYAALLVGWLFLGIVKQRKLLVFLLLFGLTWTSLVPRAVQQRVMMSYDGKSGQLDHSAETRIELWTDAIVVFRSSPVMGTGFNTYAYMHRAMGSFGGYYQDTHNIYLKFLLETGVIGILLFVWLLIKTFYAGFRLFLRAQTPLFAALGLGLAVWVLCAAVANAFGDRWTFLQVNGYMWILAGLVSEGFVFESTRSAETSEKEETTQQFDNFDFAHDQATS